MRICLFLRRFFAFPVNIMVEVMLMTMIKDMPIEEKPREKALKYGVGVLSNRELLALLLRTGTRGKNVLELADEIMKNGGGIRGISMMSTAQLCEIEGISTVKALELQVCFELNRRLKREIAMNEDVIASPGILIDWLENELGSLLQERMLAVYLGTSNHIIHYEDLFRGTINATGIYPREVFRNALIYGSTNVIVVHNHPSGNVIPSNADIQATRKLVEAGKIMGVRVLDHIIVSIDRYFSFEEEGLMIK